MKKRKDTIFTRILLTMAWLLALLLFPDRVSGRELQAVLVIDCSGSLDLPGKGTDPQKLAIRGARLLVGMADEKSTKIGIVGFSDKIEGMLPLTSLGTREGRAAVEAKLSALDFDYTGDTDLGLGLKRAMALLPEPSDSQLQAVVLFTDGQVDLPKAEDPQAAKEVSLARMEQAAQEAADGGVAIHVIALNDEELENDPLPGIAEKTGGIYTRTSAASRLPLAYMDMFAQLSDVQWKGEPIAFSPMEGEENLAAAAVDIPALPEASKAQISLVITGDCDPEQVRLTDPEGKLYTNASDEITLIDAGKIMVIKPKLPVGGRWTVELPSGESGAASMFLMITGQLDVAAKIRDGKDPQTAHISAYPAFLGQRVEDQERLAKMRASVISGNSGEVFPMELSGNQFDADIPVQFGEKISLRVQLSWAQTIRESETLSYRSTRTGEIRRKKNPEKIHLEKGQERKLVLTEYFAAWDQGSLQFEVRAQDHRILEVSADGPSCTIRAVGSGSGTLCLKASDKDGHRAQMNISVDVARPPARISRYVVLGGLLLAAAALTSIVVLLLRASSRKRLWRGELLWRLDSPGAFRQKEKHRYDLSLAAGRNRILMEDVMGEGLPVWCPENSIGIQPCCKGIRIYCREKGLHLEDEDGLSFSRRMIGFGEGFSLRSAGQDGFGDICYFALRDNDQK